MKKKMIFSFGVVAVIGMSMWALIFGVIGGSGRPMACLLYTSARLASFSSMEPLRPQAVRYSAKRSC